MSFTKVESSMINTIDASKLTGAMPAIDGSALTGISVDQELLALKTNIALNFFLDAVNHARGVQNLSDGFVDQFEDQTGVDDVNSVGEFYDVTDDYYKNLRLESLDQNFESGGSGATFGKVTQSTRNGVESAGQTFQAGANGTLSKVSYRVYKVGSPTDNIVVKLWSVIAGLPSALLATSGNIAGSTIATYYNWIDFIFSTPYSLVSGTSYAITIERTGSNSNTNFYGMAAKFSHEAAPFYDLGEMVEDIGAGWVKTASANNDFYFRIYSSSGAIQNFTLISESQTALTSPDSAHVTLFKEDVDAVTLNTDLIAWASRSKQTITATNATNVLNATTHGLSDNDRVMVTSSGQDLPLGLDSETVYYVVTSTTSTFQVALTSGGSAVTFSDDGTGTHSVLAVTAATLVNQSTISPYNTVNASVDISGQPSDTNMTLIVQTKNNKDVKIHGQSLQWS